MYLSLTLSRCSNTSGICLLIILPNAQTQLQTIHQFHAAVHPSIWPTPPHGGVFQAPHSSVPVWYWSLAQSWLPGTVLSCHPGVLFSPSHAFPFLYSVPSRGGVCPYWISMRDRCVPWNHPVSLQSTVSARPRVSGSNTSDSGWILKVQCGVSLFLLFSACLILLTALPGVPQSRAY